MFCTNKEKTKSKRQKTKDKKQKNKKERNQKGTRQVVYANKKTEGKTKSKRQKTEDACVETFTTCTRTIDCLLLVCFLAMSPAPTHTSSLVAHKSPRLTSKLKLTDTHSSLVSSRTALALQAKQAFLQRVRHSLETTPNKPVLIVWPITAHELQESRAYNQTHFPFVVSSHTTIHTQLPAHTPLLIVEKINKVSSSANSKDHVSGIWVAQNTRQPMSSPIHQQESSNHITFAGTRRMDRTHIPRPLLQELEQALFCGHTHSKRLVGMSLFPESVHNALESKQIPALLLKENQSSLEPSSFIK